MSDILLARINKITGRRKKELIMSMIKALLIVVVAGLGVLILLPKVIVLLYSCFGFVLDSKNQITRYSIGIIVRVIGIAIFWHFLKKEEIYKLMKFKPNKETFLLSWVFYIYILANIEIGNPSYMSIVPVLLMILECFVIGFYEEIIFRGLVLKTFLCHFSSNKRQVMLSVMISSVMFGLMHVSNLFVTGNLVSVIVQVFYTTIIGIFFSALFLRTKGNLLWCGFIHGLYNMVSGFGDFAMQSNVSRDTLVLSFDYIMQNLLNLSLFVPLLIYGIILLRKVDSFRYA